ncbi:MAG: winged helix DNA-binding domain-containing protein [Chloroflexi bacterium]|nr:winged helix DNA-binding domain-containing protein [Chloroflexota bacterium]
MTNRAIAHARLRNSRLIGTGLESAAAVVGWFGAVQSQDVPGALWAIAQRMGGPAPMIDDVGAAMDDGRIVRTHALRPTWHFLAPAELRWIQALTGPRVHQVAGSMYRRMGLGANEFSGGEEAIREALRGGRALTRDELAAAVVPTGIDLADSLVITHLAMHAELDALICSGPRRGKQSTYQLVDERIPEASPSLSPADALRKLTIRYFQSHGPALVHDMAWWSGLTVGSVREGIELAGSTLEGRRVDSKDYWAAAGAFDPEAGLIPEPHVLLLPNYDEALASFRDYSPMMDDALPRARNVADVLGAHIVVRDGFVVGGWRRALAAKQVTVTVTLLIPLTPAELDALDAAAAAYGRFLGLPVELRVGAA